MSGPPICVPLARGADLEGFRNAVRALIAASIPPEQVLWSEDGEYKLFGGPLPADSAPLSLPRAASDLIVEVVRHTDRERHGLLYSLVWRLTHGERALIEIDCDPLVHRLRRLARAVYVDMYSMRAHLRFRQVDVPGKGGEGARDAGGTAERFLAWFEPEHWIVEASAPFFVDRFRGMDWAILTPRGSLRWDTRTLALGPPAARENAPDTSWAENAEVQDAGGEDAFGAHWLDYYESVFNPARLNLEAMRGHMPKKLWKYLPETNLVPRLAREAPRRVSAMLEQETRMSVKRNPDKAVAAMSDQAPASLAALNRQMVESPPPEPFSPRAVLGEGPIGAALAFVGEQPGDQEDLEGRPFVGPAGKVLDRALAEAGVARGEAYVTNAVKNFKFKLVGRRRIHQSPTAGEIKHFRWWLERELAFVGPRLVVALGATAAQALAGKAMAVNANRGPTDAFGPWRGFITLHPAALLRQPDEAAKAEAWRAFAGDIRRARDLAGA